MFVDEINNKKRVSLLRGTPFVSDASFSTYFYILGIQEHKVVVKFI